MYPIPGRYQYSIGNLSWQNPSLAPIAKYLAGLTPYSTIHTANPGFRFFNPTMAAQGAAPRAAGVSPEARAHLLSIILGGQWTR